MIGAWHRRGSPRLCPNVKVKGARQRLKKDSDMHDLDLDQVPTADVTADVTVDVTVDVTADVMADVTADVAHFP